MILGRACCSHALQQLQRSCLIGLRNSPRRFYHIGKGGFVVGPGGSFVKSAVEKAHKRDGLDAKLWYLIYNDVDAVWVIAAIPALLLVLPAIIVFEHIFEDGQRWKLAKKKYFKDKMDIYAPMLVLVMAGVVYSILLRIRQTMLLRIYQSRRNPTEFLAVAPRALIGYRRVEFAQGDASAKTREESEKRTLLDVIIEGNMKIKNYHLIHENKLYRSNFFRSCMLNETPAQPPPEDL